MSKSVVLSLSGGMDSSTLMLKFLSEGYSIDAVSFHYGQRHKRELRAAENLVNYLNHARWNIPSPECPARWEYTGWQKVDIGTINALLQGSSLTTEHIEVPKGHYEEPMMKLTVVPNRNCIFLSLLSAYAISKKVPLVAFGAHAGDHAIYPDCREEFVLAMQNVVCVGNYECVQIVAPFLKMNKGEILREGLMACEKLGISPGTFYNNTWTCYEGGEEACGKCGCCIERLEAFQFCGISDPLQYAQ